MTLDQSEPVALLLSQEGGLALIFYYVWHSITYSILD